MPFYEALSRSESVFPIITKHEQGAAFMADGYARATSRLGVCCATTGPGSTNLLTGIACAHADSVPLLVITAQVSTSVFGKGAAQESTCYGIDIVDMFKQVTKLSVMLHSPEQADRVFRAAIRAAMTGRPGPVHVNIPVDYMSSLVPHHIIAPQNYRVLHRSFDREAVKETARLLIEAKCPAILVGNGVNISKANEQIRALAEKLSIPVATSPKAKGALPENHPLSLGIFGFAGNISADKLFLSGEIDVLLAVGTSLGELPTSNWDARIKPTRALIQIDVDSHEIGKNYPVDIGIIGNADTVLTELNYQLDRDLKRSPSPSASNARRTEQLKEESEPNEEMPSQKIPDGMISTSLLMREMRKTMPPDALLFVDIGSCMPWALHAFRVLRPRTFFVNLAFGSMGHAVAACIGAKFGRQDVPVYALAGDAAFAMSGMEVHTAVENKLPVVWIVINNQGHGMIRLGEKIQFQNKFSYSKFSKKLDIAGMAFAMGADSVSVSSPNELMDALARSMDITRPLVIEVMSYIEEVSPMARRFKALNDMFNMEEKHAS